MDDADHIMGAKYKRRPFAGRVAFTSSFYPSIATVSLCWSTSVRVASSAWSLNQRSRLVMPVGCLLSEGVSCVTSPGNSTRRTTHIMLESGACGAPVLDGEGTLVGTEGELLRRELGSAFVPMADLGASETEHAHNVLKGMAWSVADVMSAPVHAGDQDASLGEICTCFSKLAAGAFPVVDNSHVVGIVSKHDLLKAIASAPAQACIGGDDRIQISFLSRLRCAADLGRPPVRRYGGERYDTPDRNGRLASCQGRHSGDSRQHGRRRRTR